MLDIWARQVASPDTVDHGVESGFVIRQGSACPIKGRATLVTFASRLGFNVELVGDLMDDLPRVGVHRWQRHATGLGVSNSQVSVHQGAPLTFLFGPA